MPFSGTQIFWIVAIAALTPRLVDAIMPRKSNGNGNGNSKPPNGG